MLLIYRSVLHVFTKCSYVKVMRNFYYNPSHGKRVVVTGLGIVCPLGQGINYVWNKLLSSKVGIVALTSPEYDDLPCKVAAFVPKGDESGQFNAKALFKTSDFKMMSMSTAYALTATQEALQDAKWFPKDEKDCERTGVAVGTAFLVTGASHGTTDKLEAGLQ